MRARGWLVAVTAAAMVLTACSTDTPDGTSSTQATPTSSDAPVSGADPVSGQWIGSWTSNGERRQAILNVGTVRPLRATIDIPGRCGADWVESSRSGATINVDATVTYGACSDNRWAVVIGTTAITATDPDNAGNSLTFARG